MGSRDRYHHGDLRNALLDAAVRLVDADGVEKLSLRAVAREAGVSQAAPYHHFKDKEALVAEVCRLGFERLGDVMRTEVDGEGPALERLERIGRAYVGFAVEHRAYFALMWGGHVHDPSCYPELEASAECTFEMLVRLVGEGQARGEFRADEPALAVALGCWSAVHGAAALIVDKGLDEGKMADKGVTGSLVVEATLGMVRRSVVP